MILGDSLKVQKGGSTTENATGILFQVFSTTEGSIPAPVMTTTNKNAVSGVAGMQVYDSTLNELYLYNGSAWVLTAQIVSAPATASSTGVAGQIAYDSSYFYVCTATNTWVRTALATW
jgi:hypothetical protein